MDTTQNTPHNENGIAIPASITRIGDHWEIRVTVPFWIHESIRFDAYNKRNIDTYIHDEKPSSHATRMTETLSRAWMVSEVTIAE